MHRKNGATKQSRRDDVFQYQSRVPVSLLDLGARNFRLEFQKLTGVYRRIKENGTAWRRHRRFVISRRQYSTQADDDAPL